MPCIKLINQITAIGLAAIFAGAPALAKESADTATNPPPAFTQLIQCQALANDAERLHCYDLRVTNLRKAQENSEVVVVDKAEVQEAKRGVFGFNLPQIKLFKGKPGDDDVNELAAIITQAQQHNYGRWRFVLDNGSMWDQVDSELLAIDPRSGDAVVIKRAALGSFKARIGGQPAIRVRRVQ